MFETAMGTANLLLGEETYPIRIALNAIDNTFECSMRENEVGLARFPINVLVALSEVELVGDGATWSSPSLRGLMVLNSKSGGWNIADGEISEITGQNMHRTSFCVTKNGQHEFELDDLAPRAFEFAAGLATGGKIELSDGVFFFSDGVRSSLFGPGCKELEVSDELVALSLACGRVMRPRFEVNGKYLTMTFWQSLERLSSQAIFEDSTDGYVDLTKRTNNLIDVYRRTKLSLSKRQKTAYQLKKLIPFFLHNRQMTSILDIQMLNLFNFFEAVDRSKTLNGNSLAAVLEVEIEMAKELIQVRNKCLHQMYSMSDAIKEFVDLTRDEYKPFLTPKEGEVIPTASFMNFLHYGANSLFLKVIGSSVQPAHPYPS